MQPKNIWDLVDYTTSRVFLYVGTNSLVRVDPPPQRGQHTSYNIFQLFALRIICYF